MLTKKVGVIEKFLGYILIVLITVLVLATLWQVFSRYILGDPSKYTEEFLRFVMIWAALLGAAYAFGTEEHLSLIFFKNKLRGKSSAVMRFFIDTVSFFFAAGVLVYGGSRAVLSNMEQTSPILRLQMGYVSVILPLCGCLICFFLVRNLYFYFKPSVGKLTE